MDNDDLLVKIKKISDYNIFGNAYQKVKRKEVIIKQNGKFE